MDRRKAGAIPPFDSSELDRLMEACGLDLLLVSSKHNVQYLLGGYRFFMFDYMDAAGLSRYLPIVLYPKGRPDQVVYVGNPNEGFERDLGSLWPQHLDLRSRGSLDAMQHALEHVVKAGLQAGSIGFEAAFLPADSYRLLQQTLPDASLHDCVEVLEQLRAVKTPHELGLLKVASENVVEAMMATFRQIEPGHTKHQIVDILRREETNRGLLFEYCLITSGTDLNRAPSDRRVAEGDIISLDSGGNYGGYIGDLCRMGIFGAPSAEQEDALAIIDEIQQAARRAVSPDSTGRDVFAATDALIDKKREGRLSFVAHGMGLISHEAPRLLSDGPIPYPASHRAQKLLPGMVLSIETTWQHPRLGFIKLEDTVAVTNDGHEGFGDAARGWNRTGE